MWKFLEGAAVGAGLLAASAGSQVHADSPGGYGKAGFQHVLLISIDGMHAPDFINCAQGISGVNGGKPYCPNLAALAQTGVN
jgi:predicted AlkP superfamily pyrophosphatase or phosphodiesterase